MAAAARPYFIVMVDIETLLPPRSTNSSSILSAMSSFLKELQTALEARGYRDEVILSIFSQNSLPGTRLFRAVEALHPYLKSSVDGRIGAYPFNAALGCYAALVNGEAANVYASEETPKRVFGYYDPSGRFFQYTRASNPDAAARGWVNRLDRKFAANGSGVVPTVVMRSRGHIDICEDLGLRKEADAYWKRCVSPVTTLLRVCRAFNQAHAIYVGSNKEMRTGIIQWRRKASAARLNLSIGFHADKREFVTIKDRLLASILEESFPPRVIPTPVVGSGASSSGGALVIDSAAAVAAPVAPSEPLAQPAPATDVPSPKEGSAALAVAQAVADAPVERPASPRMPPVAPASTAAAAVPSAPVAASSAAAGGPTPALPSVSRKSVFIGVDVAVLAKPNFAKLELLLQKIIERNHVILSLYSSDPYGGTVLYKAVEAFKHYLAVLYTAPKKRLGNYPDITEKWVPAVEENVGTFLASVNNDITTVCYGFEFISRIFERSRSAKEAVFDIFWPCGVGATGVFPQTENPYNQLSDRGFRYLGMPKNHPRGIYPSVFITSDAVHEAFACRGTPMSIGESFVGFCSQAQASYGVFITKNAREARKVRRAGYLSFRVDQFDASVQPMVIATLEKRDPTLIAPVVADEKVVLVGIEDEPPLDVKPALVLAEIKRGADGRSVSFAP